MSFKLDLINIALPLTGNDPVNVAEDGSPEWRVGSAAYESAIKRLIGGHDWKFATGIVALQRTGDSDDDNYADAYARPANSLGLIWVRVNGIVADWRIIGNEIQVNGDSGVTAKVVYQPDPEEWPPLFVQAAEALTKAGIYEGLNEDQAAAVRARTEGEALLAEARSRTDREESPRAVFVSRIRQRRRGALR